MNTIKLIKGDCLEHLPNIAEESVNMILSDLPYGTIKGLEMDKYSGVKRDKVAQQYKTEWDSIIPFDKLLPVLYATLKIKGRAIYFCQFPFTLSILNAKHSEGTTFNYSLIWDKISGSNPLKAKKAHMTSHEDILVYSKQHSRKIKKSQVYAQKVFAFINKPYLEIKKLRGNASLQHFFEKLGNLQFCLCLEDSYNWLISTFGIDKMPEFICYKDLKKLYASEGSYQTYNLPAGKKSRTTVLQYKRDYKGLHPTTKPVDLLIELIETFTNPGDTILDPTMGCGSTAIACMRTGRNFIGIELDDEYFKSAKDRVDEELKTNANHKITIEE